MVRTGAASPDLIKLIMEYFNELDADKNGSLTIEEMRARVEVVDSTGAHKMARLQAVKKSLSAKMSKQFSSFKEKLNLKSTPSKGVNSVPDSKVDIRAVQPTGQSIPLPSMSSKIESV